ncbi:MAG TPA: M1 family aminopeptidase [Vicinamibacterales bacterium]|nr:M1 family aminopeptidase [Vicinamibacterales bacterium]
MKRLGILLVAAALLAANGAVRLGAQIPAPAPVIADEAGVTALITRVQRVVQAGRPEDFVGLLVDSADRARATEFANDEIRPGATRVQLSLEDRQPLTTSSPVDALRIVVDSFTEFGRRARVSTWQFDISYNGAAWAIDTATRLSSMDNIYRLSVNTAKEFQARSLTVKAEDLELTLADGVVFTIDTERGVTGLLLIGNGDMHFHPAPKAEKGQVKIFSGSETLDTRFSAAFIRLGNYSAHVDEAALSPKAVDPKDAKRAEDIFREESAKSYGVELGGLTHDAWSFLPGADDFLAEIRTKRYDTLTYSKSSSLPEDISLFDRQREHNIAIYPSVARLAARGPFYSEDDQVGYDVLDYDIDVRFTPERQWIDGRAAVHLKIRGDAAGQLLLHLADSLTVQSIVSDRFGRLFNLRIKNQNTVLVSLPALVMPDTDLTLTVTYAGRLMPQPATQETVGLGQQSGTGSGNTSPPPPSQSPFSDGFQARESTLGSSGDQSAFLRPEATFLYSNRNAWYPQSLVSDYATAQLRVSVPADLTCVSSGEPTPDSPKLVPNDNPALSRKVYSFVASRPVRYLSFAVSRFIAADHLTIAFDDSPEARRASLARNAPSMAGENTSIDVAVLTSPRQTQRAKDVAERAADIAQFYQSIVGDSPYQSFSVALVESMLPGGHSPAYFAIVDQPLPNAPVTWRDDPAAFQRYPDFFIAHELAHQWWGQAVGWRNYHEQWLSEGFAQYFAALYAQHERGDDTFDTVIHQMQKWSMDESAQGPVYFGYRIGHLRSDSRAFRAIVYDKGAMVLHMLRRLIGDDAFFKGIRRFYAESRFEKAGTDDLRRAMEAEAGQPLGRFFDRWIYGASLPQLSFSSRVEKGAAGEEELVAHFDQTGDIFDIPVTVTLNYADHTTADVIVPVTDRTVDVRVPLKGALRSVDVNRDGAALTKVQRVQ